MIVVPSLECGGLERNVSLIANNIDTRVFEVTLLVVDNRNPFYQISNPEVKLIDLGLQRVSSAIRPILHLIRKQKPRIVLSTANHLNLLMAILKPFFPKGTMLVARESSIVSINSKRAKFAPIYNGLQKIFYRRVDAVICQSVFMQDDLIAYYGFSAVKTVIIRNAVSQPVSAEEKSQQQTIAQLISVSRLSPEKGIDRVIRALQYLSVPFHFTLIGDGPERESLKNLVNSLHLNDRITFLGISATPFAMIASPDLFLMGSHYEGFPNALIEANSIGIPVIAFDAPGGIAEVIQPGQNGWLVKDGDESAFASAIEMALKTPLNRNAIQIDTLKRYDPQTIIQQWETFFKKSIA